MSSQDPRMRLVGIDWSRMNEAQLREHLRKLQKLEADKKQELAESEAKVAHVEYVMKLIWFAFVGVVIGAFCVGWLYEN